MEAVKMTVRDDSFRDFVLDQLRGGIVLAGHVLGEEPHQRLVRDRGDIPGEIGDLEIRLTVEDDAVAGWAQPV